MTEKKNFDLAVYLRLIWSKKIPLAVIGIAFMALTAPYVLFVKKEVYLSSAKVIVQKPQFIEQSPVSAEPLTVKTIASLAEDLSLIDAVLNRLRADNDVLRDLAAAIDPAWESRNHLPKAALAIAQIPSSTKIRETLPMPAEQAERIRAYRVEDIIGLLKLDPEGLQRTDPLFFRENFEARLHIDIQTAYRIDYQPIVTLAVKSGSAEGAAAIARLWRELLLDRLAQTALSVGGGTAQDLVRKQEASYRKWQTALGELSAFQKEHNVQALELEVRNLASDLETLLRPLYFRSLTESATSTLLTERLFHDLESRRLDGSWIGNQIEDMTHAQRLLAEMNQAVAGAAEGDLPGGANGIAVRREVVMAWINRERAQNALNEFLSQSDLESARQELIDTRLRIAANRAALEEARSQLDGASAALLGLEELLKGQEPEKVIDDFTLDGQLVKRRVENPVYTQLQGQKAESLALRESSLGVVRRLESSLRDDLEMARALQDRVNAAESRFAELNSRVISTQSVFDALLQDHLAVADRYRQMRLVRDMASEKVKAASRELQTRETTYIAKQGLLYELQDKVQAMTAAAASEKVAYDTIADKYSQAELVLDSRIELVQKYLDPTVPKRRLSPRRTLSCLVAGVLGIFLGISYYVFRELVFPEGSA